jgi:hypothetical protein
MRKESKPMHMSHATLVLTLSFSPFMLYGQANPAATPPQPPAAAAPVTPSSLLQPSLTQVQASLTALKMDKWKKGTVRDEATANVSAVLHDLQTNVPPLVTASDAEPGAISKSIPLIKHVDALYDVVLRIDEAARVSAPADQIDSLEQTLKTFGVARIDFYDNLQQSAAGQEKTIGDLQTTLKAQRAAVQEPKPAPAPVPCTPPKPVVKKKRPAPAKSTTPPAQPATAQPPSTQPKTP